MEFIMHLIGLCPDTHSHPDLITYLSNYPVIHDFLNGVQASFRMMTHRIVTWLN